MFKCASPELIYHLYDAIRTTVVWVNRYSNCGSGSQVSLQCISAIWLPQFTHFCLVCAIFRSILLWNFSYQFFLKNIYSFCLFPSFLHSNSNKNYVIWTMQIAKSIDVVLGIQTRGRRMVGNDDAIELWRPQHFITFCV